MACPSAGVPGLAWQGMVTYPYRVGACKAGLLHHEERYGTVQNTTGNRHPQNTNPFPAGLPARRVGTVPDKAGLHHCLLVTYSRHCRRSR